MDRINGANTIDIGGGRRGWRKQNVAAGVSGTEFDPGWFNAVQEELLAVITAAGLAPDAMTWTQLRDAIGKLIGNSAIHVGIDTGPVNALAAVVAPAVTAWSDWQVFGVTVAHTTTSTTPTLAVSGLAAKTIVAPDGSPLAIGALVAGAKALMAYDSVLDKVMLLTAPRPAGQTGALSLAAPQTLTNATATQIAVTGTAPSIATLSGGTLTLTQPGTYVAVLTGQTQLTGSGYNYISRLMIEKNGVEVGSAGDSNIASGVAAQWLSACAILPNAAVGDTIAAFAWAGNSGGGVSSLSVQSATLTILKVA